MQEKAYYANTDIDEMVFPNITLRKVGHLVRNIKAIPNYRAVVDIDTDTTFAIVKAGYKLIPHEEIISKLGEIVAEFPEYGEPYREVWLDNHGGRMKTRWTFREVDFEIGKLPDGKPDTVHPTIETFCSYDTSLAQRIIVGGFRLVCSNGMVVGKTLGSYKKKHTESLDIGRAKSIVMNGMREYSKAVDLWLSYKERKAFLEEINCYEELPFHKDEKLSIEHAIKTEGEVLAWDEDPEKRKVNIGGWDMMNILTDEISHKVKDVTRQSTLLDKVAKIFERRH